MSNPEWWERAIAGQCSHGGHGWDGDTCDDAPPEDSRRDAVRRTLERQFGLAVPVTEEMIDAVLAELDADES